MNSRQRRKARREALRRIGAVPICLSERDWNLMLSAETEPNDALKELGRRYREAKEKGTIVSPSSSNGWST